MISKPPCLQVGSRFRADDYDDSDNHNDDQKYDNQAKHLLPEFTLHKKKK